MTEDPASGYQRLDAAGLTQFRVYDAMTPRVYENTTSCDQQSASNTGREDHVDVTGDLQGGYERLDAEGLAEFQRRAQLPRVYEAVKPSDYANIRLM